MKKTPPSSRAAVEHMDLMASASRRAKEKEISARGDAAKERLRKNLGLPASRSVQDTAADRALVRARGSAAMDRLRSRAASEKPASFTPSKPVPTPASATFTPNPRYRPAPAKPAPKAEAKPAPAKPAPKPAPKAAPAKPVKNVSTKGGNYPVYKKGSAEAKSFGAAFNEARKKGEKVFTWDGRSYSTKMKGE